MKTNTHPIVVYGHGIAAAVAVLGCVENNREVVWAMPASLLYSAESSGSDEVIFIEQGFGTDKIIEKLFHTLVGNAQGMADHEIIKSFCSEVPRLTALFGYLPLSLLRHESGCVDTTQDSEKLPLIKSKNNLGEMVRRELALLVLRYAQQKKLRVFEWTEISALCVQDEVCHGVVLQSRISNEVFTIAAQNVILADGSNDGFAGSASHSAVFGRGTALALAAGAKLANPEFMRMGEPGCGGLGVDANLQTGICGLYAVGDAAAVVHGARRYPGISLLQKMWTGFCVARHLSDINADKFSDEECLREHAERVRLAELGMQEVRGPESVMVIYHDLVLAMRDCFQKPHSENSLGWGLSLIAHTRERFTHCGLLDRSSRLNSEAQLWRRLSGILDIYEAALIAAEHRHESRGLHMREDFSERDDVLFARRSLITKEQNGLSLRFEEKMPLPKGNIRPLVMERA